MWYDGFLIDTRMVLGPAGPELHVRALFRDGFEDEWHGFPDRTFSFRRASASDTRVPAEELLSARRRFGC